MKQAGHLNVGKVKAIVTYAEKGDNFFRLVVFLLCTLALKLSWAQDFDFTNYSINDGLSQSVVNCIFRDSKGYIWMGTQNGLNRFNGEIFDVFSYDPFDTTSISNNWIYAITEDRNGNIWVGTKNGLNIYLTDKNLFVRIQYQTGFQPDLTQYNYDVKCIKDGRILINTPPAITLLDPVAWETRSYKSKLTYESAVNDVRIPVLEDADGSIWAGSVNGLTRFSAPTLQFDYFSFFDRDGRRLEQVNVTALFRGKSGQLWVGTSLGLYRYIPESNSFHEALFTGVSLPEDPFHGRCVRSLLEDKEGNLIVGTEGNGLFVLSEEDEQWIVQNYTSRNSTIGHDIVQDLIIDQSENLWIGTLQGVTKTDLKKKKFKIYRKSLSPHSVDLLGNVIASLYKDDQGIVWVGNWGQGLNMVDRATGKVEHFSTQLSGNHYINNDFVHVIFEDQAHQIWLGTRKGLLLWDRYHRRFLSPETFFKSEVFPDFTSVRIYKIIQDRRQRYWIGTQNGVYLIDLNMNTVEVFRKELENGHHISGNLIYDLMEDSEGLIWIGTVSGLDVYHPENKTIRHLDKNSTGLTDDFIIALREDQYGKIWIGTTTFLNIYNKTDSSVTYFSKEQGLPNNQIFGIVRDQYQSIWLATGRGLCRYDTTDEQFKSFTLEDGLQSLEFNHGAACTCNDGEVLLGGMNGFNAFYPDSISKNPYIPNLVFTTFSCAGSSRQEPLLPANGKTFALDHRVSSFTIGFAALEFTNPKKNSYRYQMAGLSEDWTDIGNRKFVQFSGLSPGEYTFRVKGSNNDGLWNEKSISMKIIVLPPWWKSIYAILTYIVVVGLVVFSLIRIRINRLKHDKKILEQKVRERTLRIEEQSLLIVSQNQELKALNATKDKFFSIIGHDLRNQFNIIIGFLGVVISDYKKLDALKINYHLTNIYNSSVHAHQLLENLLTWARMQTHSIVFEPREFDVGPKIDETFELLEGAIERKQIQVDRLYHQPCHVYADVNMFSTVIRNLLTNAIKFTRDRGIISVELAVRGEFCEISVKDNGVGIARSELKKLFRIDTNHSTPGTHGEKGTGLGLILCQEFAERNGGQIRVESEEDQGSRFTFSLPLAGSVSH